jgi:hypothetical protein
MKGGLGQTKAAFAMESMARWARRRLARRRLSLLFGELVAQEMFGHLSGGQTG